MSVTAEQVRKVMRGSAWARRISTALLVLCAMGAIWTLYFILSADGTGRGRITIGSYVFPASALQSGTLKAWVSAIVLAISALALPFIYLLRLVFANLARGEIFCAANVRLVRNLGLLVILGGLVQWLVTAANATYFAFSGDPVAVEPRHVGFSSFTAFAHGGLLILLSWIMAVGLGVREDADELRRDAELII